MKSLPLMAIAMSIPAIAATEVNSHLGKGHLSYSNESRLRDECIQFDSSRVVREDVRSTDFQLFHVLTKEELTEKVSSSGSVTGSYGAFGGEAKAKFVREVDWNANSNYILVKATRITLRETGNQVETLLKPEAVNLLLDDRSQFTSTCGNSFVVSVDLGGEIFGLIEIKSETYMEKKKIEQSLRASGGFLGGSASGKAEFEKSVRHLMSSYRAKVDFRHLGGEQIPMPQTPEKLIELSSEIESLSDHHPVAISIQTRDYESARNYRIDDKDRLIWVRQAQINALTTRLEQTRNLHAKIAYVLVNPDDFKHHDTMALRQKLRYLDSKILDLGAELERGRSFQHTIDLNGLEVNLDIDLPEMRRRPSRRPLKASCEVRPSKVCGVALYRQDSSSACGVSAIRLGQGAVCGTVYRMNSSENCGVKAFKLGKGPACGVARYNSCLKGGKKKSFFRGRTEGRRPQCGVEEYLECRDPAFGVEEYNTCRDPMHGIERYETCRNPKFGFEYETCRHLSHGIESFNACEVASIGGEDTSCPRFF